MNTIKSLGDAITVRYLPTEKFTTDYFSVHFILPLDKSTVAGYSLLTKLFKKGCRAYPSQGALARRLEELYASSLEISVSKQGESQMISLGMDVLSSRFIFDGTPVALDAGTLLSDILFDPYLENGVFSSASVEREKAALKDQLHASINNKKTYVLKRCREIMCDGEPYSLALEGTEEDIDACTPNTLYALYLEMLRVATVEIFYIGRDPLALAEERARRLIACFGERTPFLRKTVYLQAKKEVKRVKEFVRAVQGKLALGFRTGIHKDVSLREKDALLLFNIIYGTSPVSKLFLNVRERLSLCYYCASRNDNQKGVLFVHSGVENEKADAAEKEILLQLKAIQDGSITDDEMYAAKQAFRDLTRSVADSPFTLEQWYLTRTLQGDDRTPEEMNTAIEALTKEDVMRAAQGVVLDTVFFLEGIKNEGDMCNDDTL